MPTFVLGCLLIVALLSQRHNRTASRLLAVVITCVLYRQLILAWQISGELAAHPYLFRSTFMTSLLAVALFYLYVLAMTTPDFRLTRKHLWHLLPAGFGLCWQLAFLLFAGPEYFELGSAFFGERYLRLILRDLIEIPYLIATLHQLWGFEARMKNFVSDDSKIRVHWLRLLATAELTLFTVDAADVITGPTRPLLSVVPPVSSLIILAIGFFSLRYSAAFSQELELERVEGENKGEHLSDAEVTNLTTRLLDYLEKEQPYLRPDLRLLDLSQALSLKPYLVSETIKRGLQTNFYDLVNTRRVETAKRLIADPAYAHLNLMGIGLESGFNSKSVFNSVFKKQTNMTPSEYRATTNESGS
ncbi:MAG: helix-turn-helix domain-containing protein [Bdellovibrionota bacterium]